MTKDNKFCFIICTNNELYLDECIHYICHLNVPDGYEVEVLTVVNAESMTAGYNEAMLQSDAKYKIYMHQDVFLINKNILNDILEIFLSDKKIGLIGCIGYETVSADGIMWHGRCRGKIYKTSGEKYPEYATYRYSKEKDGYYQVALIDGLFMATSRDLAWNRELKHWDFYDAFQSVNFLENGYKIVVPGQRYPWCIHDDNKILNLLHYDQYRQLFMKRYENILGKHVLQIQQMVRKG